MAQFAQDDNQGNEKYTGEVLNPRRRAEVIENQRKEQANYERLMARRPEGGSGVLGGTIDKIEGEPSVEDIMQTMQRCDIDYDEARLFIMQTRIQTNPRRAVKDPHTTRILKQKEQAQNRRRKREEIEKEKIASELRKKKVKARQQAVKNERAKRNEAGAYKRESQAHADERRKARIVRLENGTNSKNIKDGKRKQEVFNATMVKEDQNAAKKNSSQYFEKRTMELLTENSVLKEKIKQLKRQSAAMVHSNTDYHSHQNYLSSEDWVMLLNCKDQILPMALEYLATKTKAAEEGECEFPAVEYAIACAKDSCKAPAPVERSESTNTGGESQVVEEEPHLSTSQLREKRAKFYEKFS